MLFNMDENITILIHIKVYRGESMEQFKDATKDDMKRFVIQNYNAINNFTYNVFGFRLNLKNINNEEFDTIKDNDGLIKIESEIGTNKYINNLHFIKIRAKNSDNENIFFLENNSKLNIFNSYIRIYFNCEKFFEKYSEYYIKDFMTLFIEEIFITLYINKTEFCRFESQEDNQYIVNDTKLWILSKALEASSYYDFKTILTPSKMNMPEKLDALSYYFMMKNKINSMNQESSNGNSTSNNQDNDINNQNNENQSNQNNNKQSNENLQSNNTNNMSNQSNNDEDNNYNNSGTKSNSDSSNITSDEEISELISKYCTDQNVKKNTLKLCNSGLDNNISNNFIDNYIERNEVKNNKIKENKKLIDSIEKDIIKYQEQMKIQKTEKKSSYSKYSWKNDKCNGRGNIIFPGKKRVTGGASKRFKETPVVFFDFSGSTYEINSILNIITQNFHDKGYITVIYSGNLKNIIYPDTITYFDFPSSGGTDSFKAVNDFFQLSKDKGYEYKNIERRNIYIVTDGVEDYSGLFLKYPNTKIYQIKDKFVRNKYTDQRIRTFDVKKFNKNNFKEIGDFSIS